jgi:colanic acid biosynthesis protein WcaH
LNSIPKEEYKRIIDELPILCVDIAAQNERGEYLLVKRANPPKKDHWWVIGGRVLKGETLAGAAARKLKEEVGVTATELTPIGYMELPVDDNPFGGPANYHAVSVVFRATLADSENIALDSQSSDWKWAAELPSDFPLTTFEDLV